MSSNLLETYRKERRGLYLMGLALTGSPAAAERAILEAFAAAARKRRAEPQELYQATWSALSSRPAPDSTIETSLFQTAEDGVDASDTARRAVDRTLPQDKAILVLRLHSSLAIWQIAEALSLPLETAAAHLRRTLKRLGKRVATGAIEGEKKRRDKAIDRELLALPWLRAPDSIEDKLRIIIRVEQRRGGEAPLVFGLVAALALIALSLTAVYLVQSLEEPEPAPIAAVTPKPAPEPVPKKAINAAPVLKRPPELTAEQRAARARLFAEAARARPEAPATSGAAKPAPLQPAADEAAPYLERTAAPEKAMRFASRAAPAPVSGGGQATWHVAAGFVSRPSSGELTLYLGLPRAACLVTAVMDGGPAARAGLAPFDLILGFEGQELFDGAELEAAMQKAGGRGVLMVLRRGRRCPIELKSTRSLESRRLSPALSAR